MRGAGARDGGEMGPVGFDLDMTLIDSRPAILASFAGLARDTAAVIDLAAVDRRLGIKLEDELGVWYPPEQRAEAAQAYRGHYVRLAEQMTTALPGAHEALAAVRGVGERVVIITAKHPISVAPSLRAVGLDADEVFTFVHGPEKAAVLSRSRAAAYVGDSPPDMAAAVQAGLRAAGAATGSFSRGGRGRARARDRGQAAWAGPAVPAAGGAEPRPDVRRGDDVPGFGPGRPHRGGPRGRVAHRGAEVVALPDPVLVHDRLVVVADEPVQVRPHRSQGAGGSGHPQHAVISYGRGCLVSHCQNVRYFGRATKWPLPTLPETSS